VCACCPSIGPGRCLLSSPLCRSSLSREATSAKRNGGGRVAARMRHRPLSTRAMATNVQPRHWSIDVPLVASLRASPKEKRVCVDVLTRGLTHPSSVLTPGSWEANKQHACAHGPRWIGRSPEQTANDDRGLCVTVTCGRACTPGRATWHGMGGTTTNVRAEPSHVIYSSTAAAGPDRDLARPDSITAPPRQRPIECACSQGTSSSAPASVLVHRIV
jgi:hypothetical protein